ncbi:GtrA family protein, partial [Corynebacterium sp.]
GLPEHIFDNSTGLRTRSYWGNFIGVIVAVPANFLFNKLWTFRNKGPKGSSDSEGQAADVVPKIETEEPK